MDEEHDQVPQCQCRVGGARGRMEFDFVIAVALAPGFEIQRAAKILRHVVVAIADLLGWLMPEALWQQWKRRS